MVSWWKERGRTGRDEQWVSGLDEPGLLAMGSAGIVDCLYKCVCYGVKEVDRPRMEGPEEKRYICIPQPGAEAAYVMIPFIDTRITSLQYSMRSSR